MKRNITILSLFIAVIGFGQLDSKLVNETLLKHLDNSKFDSIAKVLGYQGGDEVRVLSMFNINENGNVVDIIARGPHAIFENEAKRIINKLPKMNPVVIKGKPTSTRFSLPITFIIQTEEQKRKRRKKEKKKRKKNSGTP